RSDPGEVLEFAKRWENRCPLVIVPTKYYSTPTNVFEDVNVSLVIWANHMIRASINAMESISRQIFEDNSVVDIEDKIANINRIFSLQGVDELDQANKKYLASPSEYSAVILAASRGKQLHELTGEKPKAMLNINGVPLLQRLVMEFRENGITEINVVAGYKSETININDINIITNDDYESSNELASLYCAVDSFTDNMIVIYGDLLFRNYILRDFIETNDNITVVVDSAHVDGEISGMPDYVYCDKADDRSLFKQDVNLVSISESHQDPENSPSGRWIGMLKVNHQGKTIIQHALTDLSGQDNFSDLTIPDLLNHILHMGHEIKVHYINGHWLDVNDLMDIERAGNFINTSAQS
ncbi:MAG: NTP transferase domain-containing protein, partial [Gammaproteobacteria bacterium]|nr:NTP transferase domain-containing protein [Gammaproteobacteria bacterium]